MKKSYLLSLKEFLEILLRTSIACLSAYSSYMMPLKQTLLVVQTRHKTLLRRLKLVLNLCAYKNAYTLRANFLSAQSTATPRSIMYSLIRAVRYYVL